MSRRKAWGSLYLVSEGANWGRYYGTSGFLVLVLGRYCALKGKRAGKWGDLIFSGTGGLKYRTNGDVR